jgi:hypothetical protein
LFFKKRRNRNFYDPVSVDSRLDASFSEEFLRIFSKSKPFHIWSFEAGFLAIAWIQDASLGVEKKARGSKGSIIHLQHQARNSCLYLSREIET